MGNAGYFSYLMIIIIAVWGGSACAQGWNCEPSSPASICTSWPGHVSPNPTQQSQQCIRSHGSGEGSRGVSELSSKSSKHFLKPHFLLILSFFIWFLTIEFCFLKRYQRAWSKIHNKLWIKISFGFITSSLKNIIEIFLLKLLSQNLIYSFWYYSWCF